MLILFTNQSSVNESLESNLSSDSDSGTSLKNEECSYDKGTHLTEKFYFITICGSSLALWATVNNTILVYLLTRHRLFVSQFFHLAVLAAFDILICVSYMLIFSVQNLYDVYEIFSLYEAWMFYLKPVFAVSHVSMTVSTYMIVAASAERYLTTTRVLKRNCVPKDRAVAAFCIFCFAMVTKGVVYWELDAIYKPNCTKFERYELVPSALAMDPLYRRWYVLWFRHIVHVFLPFISLVVLNGAIIMKLKRTPKMKWIQEAIRFQNYNNADSDRRTYTINQRKKNIRQATLMLVVIVSTYLVSNVLNIIITVLENFDRDILLNNRDFYSFSTDVVSLLTVLTSAIRLPTYYIFNKQVRREIHLLFKKIFVGKADKNGELELTSTIA